MDEIRFDIHARVKSLRDRNLIKYYFNKRAILASVFKRSEGTIFVSENPNELCDRLCLIIQEKRAGNDTTRFHNEFVGIIDKLLDYKRITPLNTKKIIKKDLILYKICDYFR